MNIEKLARKLEPLMGEKVRHWMRVREMADAEMKDLLDKQIITEAYSKLGDFHRKILLSLPPEKVAKGSINLGTIQYEAEKWPVGITPTEMLQNMVVLGRSGAGKTNVSFHILRQLVERKTPFLFLDWKRTVRHLTPLLGKNVNFYTPGRSLLKFPFNPFVVPPGTESHVYINQVMDVMSDAYTLGDGSRSLLRAALTTLYGGGNLCPTAKDIIAEIEKVPDKERVRGWKITALRAMESLDFSDLSADTKITQEQLAHQLLEQNTVIELDGLAQESKKFLVPLLCLWLYYVRLQSPEREKLKLVIFIEEAHHVLYRKSQGTKESVLEMFFRQCRELGIAIVVLDQHAHLLSPAALGNTYTTICLSQKDPTDINKLAALCLVDKDDKGYFSMLPVGQGIVKLQDRWMQPFLVQFPLVNLKKGAVTDAILARYFSGISGNPSTPPRSGRNTPSENAFGQVPRVPLFDNALNEAAFELLEDVLRFPDDGVKVRYKRLGLSMGTGNRLKRWLVKEGWLKDQMVELGQTRKLLLRLPTKAKKLLGLKGGVPERASLVHEYWKRFYADRLSEAGYRVQLEAPRNSGAVDVLAQMEGKTLAVEIETGKSDILRNVKQNLLSRFDNILIIATDKKAFQTIESTLAQGGLLGLKKIAVLLRDSGMAAYLNELT